MTIVRPLRPGEGGLLLALTRALAEHHGDLEHLTATADMFEHEFFKRDSLIGALVAEDGGQLVGCAVWHRSFSTFRGREVFYLEDLSVLEEYRGRGVGRALMQALARLALERGLPSIYWVMMGWNKAGRQFYESLGAEIEDNTCHCRIHGEALARLAQ
jgi:GNAT superfamily N-acetyltransferase